MLGKNFRQKVNNNRLLKACLNDTSIYEDSTSNDEVNRIGFRENYDIDSIHVRIIAKLSRKPEVSWATPKIAELELQLKYSQTMSEKIQLGKEITRLKASLPVNGNLQEYLEKSNPLIQAYAKRRIFKTTEPYSPTPEDIERLTVICEYLDLAKKYIPLDYTCTGFKREIPWNLCSNCFSDLLEDTIEKGYKVVCSRCSTSNVLTFNGVGLSNGKILKLEPTKVDRMDKDKAQSITLAFHNFQGKIPPPGDVAKVIDDLDKYFVSIKKGSSEYYKSLPAELDGRKKDTNLNLMRKGLQLTKHNTLYQFTRYFCIEMWGWEMQDISSILNEVLLRDKEFQEAWDAVPVELKERSSLPSEQIRLYWYLGDLGVSCDREDFQLPKTLEKYNIILERCQQYGGLARKYPLL